MGGFFYRMIEAEGSNDLGAMATGDTDGLVGR